MDLLASVYNNVFTMLGGAKNMDLTKYLVQHIEKTRIESYANSFRMLKMKIGISS